MARGAGSYNFRAGSPRVARSVIFCWMFVSLDTGFLAGLDSFDGELFVSSFPLCFLFVIICWCIACEGLSVGEI